MNDLFEHARQAYQNQPVPEELSERVEAALLIGKSRRESRRRVTAGGDTAAFAGGGRPRRRLFGEGAALAAASLCLAFCITVNASPVFAASVYEIPVLGSIARVVTVRRYDSEDETKLIHARVPAISNTGNSELESRVNYEISERVDAVLEEAEARAAEYRAAFIDTGGKAGDFMPVMIDIDYDIKCNDSKILSFVILKTETMASAYTEFMTYNIDLETGRELTLRDLFTGDYIADISAQIIRQIRQREAEDPENVVFFDDELGFTEIAPDQRFYINEDGKVVIFFEKYEIAPGYMGSQEFVVEGARMPE